MQKWKRTAVEMSGVEYHIGVPIEFFDQRDMTQTHIDEARHRDGFILIQPDSKASRPRLNATGRQYPIFANLTLASFLGEANSESDYDLDLDEKMTKKICQWAMGQDTPPQYPAHRLPRDAWPLTATEIYDLVKLLHIPTHFGACVTGEVLDDVLHWIDTNLFAPRNHREESADVIDTVLDMLRRLGEFNACHRPPVGRGGHTPAPILKPTKTEPSPTPSRDIPFRPGPLSTTRPHLPAACRPDAGTRPRRPLRPTLTSNGDDDDDDDDEEEEGEAVVDSSPERHSPTETWHSSSKPAVSTAKNHTSITDIRKSLEDLTRVQVQQGRVQVEHEMDLHRQRKSGGDLRRSSENLARVVRSMAEDLGY